MGAEASPIEIDRALTVLAYYGGNAERAGKELGIPGRTLRDWRSDLHRERYLEIAEREGPRLEALAAQHAREVLIRAADVEHQLLDRLTELELSSKEMSELAGALQRVATAKGINTTKLLELTGRPTSIVEHRDPADTVNALARKLGIVIDGTATEMQLRPPTQALTPKSADANARSAPVQTTPDHAAD